MQENAIQMVKKQIEKWETMAAGLNKLLGRSKQGIFLQKGLDKELRIWKYILKQLQKNDCNEDT